ncbi:MAG: 16S rRNA (guanine(527)-N(7))-methyltransferase RsmG [Methylococcales bacterium]|nr:16S rRNA (guanine(527)-N(7))-methyltransferase RsmG [Methylococcales bacterium]
MTGDHSVLLQRGLSELGIAENAGLSSRLLAFLALLSKWNKVYNLTAIRDPEAMITHHLLDSLSVSTLLSGQRVLDVGTGPGLPGIPLSMAHLQREFVLIDSSAKKTRFIRQAKLEMGLKNVDVIHQRVEQFENVELFDTIVTRAYSSVERILSSAAHLLKPGGRILAMRGRIAEADEQYAGFRSRIIPVDVPGIAGGRHILMMTPDIQEQEQGSGR